MLYFFYKNLLHSSKFPTLPTYGSKAGTNLLFPENHFLVYIEEIHILNEGEGGGEKRYECWWRERERERESG